MWLRGGLFGMLIGMGLGYALCGVIGMVDLSGLAQAPWVQVVSQINPVRHFVTIARGILIKGAGLADLLQPLLILAVFGVVMISLAVAMYRKRTA